MSYSEKYIWPIWVLDRFLCGIDVIVTVTVIVTFFQINIQSVHTKYIGI